VETLKTSSEVSNSDLLSEFLAKHLITYEVKSENIILIDYNIQPGVYTRIDSDECTAKKATQNLSFMADLFKKNSFPQLIH
jgi:hypothetical protein